MRELLLRFVVGGALVSVFALLGDLFRPKSFAGLFAAVLSVALATLILAATTRGPTYVAVEARSMVVGCVALLAYSTFVVRLLAARIGRPRVVATVGLIVWVAVAATGWAVVLRGTT
jgi:hypothetical protein